MLTIAYMTKVTWQIHFDIAQHYILQVSVVDFKIKMFVDENLYICICSKLIKDKLKQDKYSVVLPECTPGGKE